MAADCRLYQALGLLIAFPYLARNVLISGWLFYPFTFLDWFPVDWKISKGYANSDAKEIQAYAREIYNVYHLDQPLKQWLPNWFAAQAGFDKLLVLAGWAAIPVSAVLAVLGAARAVRADGRRLRPMRAALRLNEKSAHPCPPAESHILRPCVFPCFSCVQWSVFSSGSLGRRWCGTDIFMCCFCR